MSRARVLGALAALALCAAAAAPLAHAFFFEATDQPLTLAAATPQQYVVLHSTATEPTPALRPFYARARSRLGIDPRTFAAAGGGDAPLALDLGQDSFWGIAQRKVDAAFTLEATKQLPGDAPVGVTLETAGPLKAELRETDVLARRVAQLAEPQARGDRHRARVDLVVTSPNADGEFRATVTVKFAFADGSRMRYVVPVVWRDL